MDKPTEHPNQKAMDYCANEYYAGYGCGIKECPTCGGVADGYNPDKNSQKIS